jgi:hypothetical protein
LGAQSTDALLPAGMSYLCRCYATAKAPAEQSGLVASWSNVAKGEDRAGWYATAMRLPCLLSVLLNVAQRLKPGFSGALTHHGMLVFSLFFDH